MNSSIHVQISYLLFFQKKTWNLSDKLKNFVVVSSPGEDISYGNMVCREIFSPFLIIEKEQQINKYSENYTE